jgi:hypothetical protein
VATLRGRQPEGEAGEDHAVEVRRAPGIGPHHLERTEGAGARHGELEVAEFGEQVTAIAAVAAIGGAEFGHALEVLINHLPHAAFEQRPQSVAGALPKVLAPLDAFGLHGLHHPERSG